MKIKGVNRELLHLNHKTCKYVLQVYITLLAAITQFLTGETQEVTTINQKATIPHMWILEFKWENCSLNDSSQMTTYPVHAVKKLPPWWHFQILHEEPQVKSRRATCGSGKRISVFFKELHIKQPSCLYVLLDCLEYKFSLHKSELENVGSKLRKNSFSLILIKSVTIKKPLNCFSPYQNLTWESNKQERCYWLSTLKM